MPDQDTAPKDEGRGPSGDAAPEPEGATKTTDAPSDESFIDPSDLPEELKPHWKRMHRAFSQGMKSIKDTKEKAALVDRFNSEPEFARQAAMEVLQRQGFTVQQAAAATGQAAGSTVTAPRELVAAIQAQLSPELQWMAPSLANAQWASVQLTLGPYAKKQEDERQRSKEDAYEVSSEQLSERYPGWEEQEDDMNDLLTFLKSDQQTHRRFGSKLEVLFRIVNPSAAIAEAQRRQAESARARTVTGRGTRQSGPDATERIRKAATEQEAWDIAAKEALAELERQGTRTT